MLKEVVSGGREEVTLESHMDEKRVISNGFTNLSMLSYRPTPLAFPIGDQVTFISEVRHVLHGQKD